MRALGRSFPVLVSAWAHVGIVLSLLAFVGGSPISADRGGDGAVDAGGEDFGSATEDELDFGPVSTHLIGIGIVVDASVVRADVVESPSVFAPPAASEPVPVKPAPKRVAKAEPKAVGQNDAVERLASKEEKSTEGTEAALMPPEVSVAAEAVATDRTGERGRKPSGKGEKKPCPVVEDDGVEKLGDHAWTVERDVAEYYAGHLKELQKIASVRQVKNDDGKPDGFRVGVPRCSILREGGLRSGDVVKAVNGIHVHDVFTAIGAYFKLRREETIVLNVVRKGEKLTLRYTMV